jgi:hypothetical protein
MSNPKDLNSLRYESPKSADLLSTIVAAATKDIENQLGDLPSDEKKKLAEQQTIDLLRKVYNGADMVFNFHPAADFLVLE